MKVGDELAFKHYDSRYSIHTITKILPSGRIRCGNYELEPDLSIRGRGKYSLGPVIAEPVTQEIRDIVAKQRYCVLLAKVNWQEMPLELLSSIWKTISSHKDESKDINNG